MSKLSLETVESHVEKTKSLTGTKIAVLCDNSSIIIDKQAVCDIGRVNVFIDYVVREAFGDIIRPSYFSADVAFIAYFLEMFTNFPVPKEKNEEGIFQIDTQKTYEMACAMELVYELDSLPIVKRLKGYINKQVEFENQEILSNNSVSHATDEAIETVSELANMCLNMANKACDVIDNVNNSIESGELLKSLKPETIDSLFKGLQNTIDRVGLIIKKNNIRK